jgi:succinoglycan biosynthesis protein ExoA
VAYRKSVFEKVGLFDEHFDACEDVEMNTRIDAAGLKCWFDPAIAVRYVPRKTIRALALQMERYGRGRVRLWRKHRHTASLKSFAPGFFVVGAIVAGLILLFHTVMRFAPEYFGLVRGLSPFNALAWLSVVALGTYAMAILAESIRALLRWIFFQRESEPAERRAPFLCPTVFCFIHFGYGWGVLRELFFPKR